VHIIKGKGEDLREKHPRKPQEATRPGRELPMVMTGCAVELVFISDKAGAFLSSGDNLGHLYLGGRVSPEKRL
jgi:hypothetical protein